MLKRLVSKVYWTQRDWDCGNDWYSDCREHYIGLKIRGVFFGIMWCTFSPYQDGE